MLLSILWITNGVIGIMKRRIRLIGNNFFRGGRRIDNVYEGKSAITAGMLSIASGILGLFIVCIIYLKSKNVANNVIIPVIISSLVIFIVYAILYIYLTVINDRTLHYTRITFRCPKCNSQCQIVCEETNEAKQRERQSGFYCKKCQTAWDKAGNVMRKS